MIKWIKKKWNKLYWWYQRVFHKRCRTIKPSGTLSILTGTTTEIEPYYRKDKQCKYF